MIDKIDLEKLKSFVPETAFRLEEPLKNHTTFKVGGKADVFLSIQKAEQLQNVLQYLKSREIPFFIVGNGSNLLVSDGGYRGVILHIGNDFSGVEVTGTRIKAEAGALLSSVAAAAQKHSLTGLEFASGIPGSTGGAVVMNAGAYGGEMSQVIESVTVLNQDGTVTVLPLEQLDFSYRNSRIKKEKSIVLSVTFLLKQGNSKEIRGKMKDFADRRREKQPLEYPSAGSTFKRPEGYYAGKLIMEAGLAGYSVGDAEVSEKHCGFIINKGHATARDIYTLIRNVQKQVDNKFSVKLEPEVIFLGDMEKE